MPKLNLLTLYSRLCVVLSLAMMLVACGGAQDNEDGVRSVQGQIETLELQSATGITPEKIQQRDADDRPNILVIFTDDQGYADVGAYGVASDIQTPNIDLLASAGVRMTAGYSTAPQCTPSRAGLITGRYQQRFGLDDNRHTPMPLSEVTIAERMQALGYRTGMVGKWHLEIDRNSIAYDNAALTPAEREPFHPDNHGFDDLFFGYTERWWTNYSRDGSTHEKRLEKIEDYRIEIATDAALSFIERSADEPFFLYLNYYAPHVPLEAPDKYLKRFEHIQELRRRYGLAMMAAIDDGVGELRQQLQELGLTDNTMIFFISDNGAPLGLSLIHI